ncbi:terminase [Microbacterium sp. CFH 90308]|uniref:Terminase n=1 Tax=Microbacterium salsuginis TaxID=2722803 RepID=A0ABX1K9D3_9MICO|nr:terminase [Microbacterium sp. CFH 90308]NLP82598.1 terminase [Microbacterium sp. CFH 90308]
MIASGGTRLAPQADAYERAVYADAKQYGQHVGATEPRLCTKPLRDLTPETSHGFSVIDFARDVLGVTLYPWQKALLIRALELNEDGTYRFRKVFVLVGRQNGKTTLLTVLALWWLFVDADSFPEHLPARDFLILGTAQNLDIAEEAWDAALKRCDPTPDEDDEEYVVEWLATETRKPVKTNGKKSLRLRNNAKYEPRAASRMGGRGKSAARVIMDEMREQQTWDVWGSVSKTKNAIFNSQLWGISSAGDIKSVVLRTLRDGAIKTIREYEQYVESGIQTLEEFANTHDVATALFEWSAEPGKPLLDIPGILQANPSVGYKPMFFESIWSDLLGDEPEATKRTEILCDWVTSRVEPFIKGDGWSSSADGPVLDDDDNVIELGSQIADGSRMTMGIDVMSSARSTSSVICVAGYRTDGRVHLELIAQRTGMSWVVKHAKAVRAKTGINQVALQTRGCPAADLVEDLKEAGFDVVSISGSTLLTSADRLNKRIQADKVRHRSQGPLDLAIANGTTKDLSGMPVWDRYGSPVDTSPAVAATNALVALEAFVPPPKKPPPPPPPAAQILTRDDVESTAEASLAVAAF